jgi:hypothetical protein
MSRFGLRLTPQGRLVAEDQEDAPEIDTQLRARLAEAFAQGSGYSLVRLGAGEVGQALSPVFVWWRAFATRYVGALCLNASGREEDVTFPVVPVPDAGELASLVLNAPMMEGAEYLTEAVLLAMWDEMAQAFAAALAASCQQPADACRVRTQRPAHAAATPSGRDPGHALARYRAIPGLLTNTLVRRRPCSAGQQF